MDSVIIRRELFNEYQAVLKDFGYINHLINNILSTFKNAEDILVDFENYL
jgi:hypothetical protein